MFELILKYFSGVELFVCVLFDQLFEMIGQRKPRSACSGKSSLTRVYTNYLSIATCTCLSRKASECKSLRRCRHCERVHVCGEGWGDNNQKLKDQPAHEILVHVLIRCL